MLNNKHKYKFLISEKDSTSSYVDYQKIKVCCKLDGDEAYLYSLNGGGDYSLYLEDRFFNFNVDNETKSICSFEGDVIKKRLKYIKIKFPNIIKEAILSIDTQEDLQSGCGGYISFNADKLYYDEEQKILQIGDIDVENITYKIFENAFAQIKEDVVTGILVTELEL